MPGPNRWILAFALAFCLLQLGLCARFERIEGYTHRNGDCGENDIVKLSRTTVAYCARRCNELNGCKSFLFNDKGRRRSYCWLKNSECPRLTFTSTRNYHFYNKVERTTTPDPWLIRTTPRPTDGQACWYTLEVADCGGHDIHHTTLNLTSCRAACSARDDCRSFQLYQGNDCWLKNFICSKRLLKHVGDERYAQYTKHCRPVQQVCSYTVETADCAGRDIRHALLDLNACRDACSARADCKSFQLFSYNECWLKNYVCSRSELTHVGDRRYQQYTRQNCDALPSPTTTYPLTTSRDHGHTHGSIERATTPDPWSRRTTSYPWWSRTTSYPWWSRTTSYPWWSRTTSGSRWSRTTSYPWWSRTTSGPWGSRTTSGPWGSRTTPMPTTIDVNTAPGYSRRQGDCPGNDIRKLTSTTIRNCANQCNELENCQSFIYNERGRYCWLKHSACPRLTDTYVRHFHFYNKMATFPSTTATSPTAELPQNVQVDFVFMDPIVALVSWDAPRSSARVLYYQVSYGKKGSAVTKSWEVHGMRMFYAPFLESGATYEFKIAAKLGVIFGEFVTISKVIPTKTKVESVSNVPFALRNCTMKRVNDARMLAGSIEPVPEINDEGECAAKCLDNPLCESATFTNKTKTCSLHPRRNFRWGYMSEENCCVMYKKECPLLTNLNSRYPPEQVLCPIERTETGIPVPSTKNRYRQMRYAMTYVEAEYSCRTDELCAGISNSTNNGKNLVYFYFDMTPEEGAPTNESVGIKNCEQSGSPCNYLTAFYDKSVKNVQPYSKPTRRSKRDCAYACEADPQCYAATFAWRMSSECKLYHYPQDGGLNLETYPNRGSAMTYIKDAPKCYGGIYNNEVPIQN